MDEEIITISSSSNSSSGCSSAEMIDSGVVNSKNTQEEEEEAEVKASPSSSDHNNGGSITTEPLRDSDAACDWEIYETWTILGEPVMKPIIIEATPAPSSAKPLSLPQPIQEQPKVRQMMKPIVAKQSNGSESADFIDVIKDDQCVIVSDPGKLQKASNVLTVNSLNVISNDVGSRSDCDTPSDGISIISDCSDCGNHRHSPLPTIDAAALLGHIDDIPRNFDTPPNTPGTESSAPSFKIGANLAASDSSEKFSLESRTSRPFDVVSPANIILFSLLAGITGIVLGNAFRVRHDEDSSILNHISPLVLRIQDLERENSDLKTQLKKLKSSTEGGNPSGSQGVEMIFPQPLEFYLEQNINENGKRVWTGDPDNEEPITLENTKMKMPEFCSEDVNDDLFSERYQKICDEKVRKLSKTVQNVKHQNCDAASSTCSGCQSQSTSSTTKQSDVEANFADDDESSVDRVKVERDKSPHLKRKLKRQKPVKGGDESDSSSSEATVINNNINGHGQDRAANIGCKKGGCAGIFDKRKTGKKIGHDDKENKKTKKPNGDDWYEKRKAGRDELRRSNGGGAASSGADDWYSKRASNREKQRTSGADKKK